MGKKLDVITDKCKCIVRAHIIEDKKEAKPITVDIANNPKQKCWMGKRKGDTYKAGVGVTYKIDAIEEYLEAENIFARNDSKPSIDGGGFFSNRNNSSLSKGASSNMSTNLIVRSIVFWVFQNQTYDEESYKGYIFAGFHGPHHWERLREVRKDHIILHSYRQEVVAVSVAKGSAYSWNRGDGIGRRVDCEYHRLRRTISTSARSSKNAALCAGAMYQPFNSNGTGNQGYLYDMTSKLRDYYISEIIKYNPYLVDEIPELRKYNTL
jgi:hypothetical protein